VADFIGPSLLALKALANFDFAKDSPTGSAMGWFFLLVQSLVQNAVKAAALFTTEGLAAATAFANAAKAVVEMIPPALTALAGMRNFVGPTEASMDAVLEGIRYIVRKFEEMSTHMSTEGVKHMGEFSVAAGQALGAAQAGVDLFLKFKELVIPSRNAIDNLYEGIKYVVQRFWDTAQRLETEGIDQMKRFAAAAQECLNAAKAGTDLFHDFEKLVIPSQQAIDDLFNGIVYVVNQMGATALRLGGEGLLKAQNFATACLNAFTTLKNALNTLASIKDYKDNPSRALDLLKGALDDAIGKMLDRETQARVLKESAKRFEADMGAAKIALEHGLSLMGMQIPNVAPPVVTVSPGGGSGGSGPGIGRRATGGPVQSGQPYWVGDGGEPELFIPNQSGRIVPQSKVPQGGGGGDTIIINVGGSVVSERELVEVVHTGLLRKKRGNVSLGL
jgi:hypothetical protein